MKTFKKIMVMALAVLMVGLIAGSVDSEAATGPKLSKTSKTIYVGGSSVDPDYSEGSYVFTVKNLPADYTVTWNTSNKRIATVAPKSDSAKYKGRVTAVGVGTATITATVIDKTKTPNVAYTLSARVTVRKNCSALAVVGAPASGLEVGRTVQLTGVMYNNKGDVADEDELTDIVMWESSDTTVATVSSRGLVTALSEGITKITCYTVQDASGEYSELENATCSRTVTISCKKESIRGISAVSQKTLNSIAITFDQDYSKIITKDNNKLQIRQSNGVDLYIDSLKWDSTGTVATVTAINDLNPDTTYTVTLVGTEATTGATAQFKTASKTPVWMELYTDAGDGICLTNQDTRILFRLYNEIGVDVTPEDGTAEYYDYFSKIEIEDTSDYGGIYYLDEYQKTICFYQDGETAVIKATYSDYDEQYNFKEMCVATLKCSSVNEADTIIFLNATIADRDELGENINWMSPRTYVRSNDYTGCKIIARCMNIKGEYIYSTDANSQISFSPNSYRAASIEDDGTIWPSEMGNDAVTIYYGSGENARVIGATTVVVKEARKAASIKLMYENASMPSTLTVSNASNAVGIANIAVYVYDQDKKLLSVESGSLEIDALSSASGQPTIGTGTYSDGAGKLTCDCRGKGTSAVSTSYRYKLTYTSADYGTATASFTLKVVTPSSSATSSYSVVATGSMDMSLSSSLSQLPQIDIKVYELRKTNGENIRYNSPATVYTSSAACPSATDFYYTLYNASGSVVSTSGVCSNNVIKPVYLSGVNTLAKLATGKYTVKVFKKGSSTVVATTTFTLTDSNKGVTWRQKSATTDREISYYMTSDEMLDIFADCFEVKAGNDVITSFELINPISSSKTLFFRSVKANQQITVGGTTYSVPTTLTINKGIAHVDATDY